MKVKEIAKQLDLELRGDPETDVSSVMSLERAGREHLTFLLDPKAQKPKSEIGCLVCRTVPEGIQAKAYLIADDPRKSMPKILGLFDRNPVFEPGVHEGAAVDESTTLAEGAAVLPHSYVGKNVSIGKNTVVHPFAYVGEDVEIGQNCEIHPLVYVGNRTEIGDRVIVFPGAILGGDGFGFAREDDKYIRIPQLGRVVIEDDCEIGACATIDRATLGETRIRRGTKIDNLVMVAHNVEIGEDSVIAGQSGIAGSSRIGSGAVLAGQVGIADHLEIADGVIITAKTGVAKNILKRGVYSGYFARERAEVLKAQSIYYRLPGLLERIKRIEKELNLGETKDTEEIR
jgi:UDP-3-O-[3-hydroxymyristoyl] glucosamine N-acyltransferase